VPRVTAPGASEERPFVSYKAAAAAAAAAGDAAEPSEIEAPPPMVVVSTLTCEGSEAAVVELR